MAYNYRFDASEVQDALAVVGQGMARNYKIRVVWHSGHRVCADVEHGIVKLPRLACASTLGLKSAETMEAVETALSLTRSNSAHEFGHCAFTKLTPAEKPTGTLFKILNSLEDPRMERRVVVDYPGYRAVFDWANEHHNKAIAGEILDGKLQGGALWQAMCACIFQCQGIAPAWTLQGKAKQYFDVAYPDFVGVLAAQSTRDCLDIAKKIFANLKDLLEQEKKEQKQKQQEREKKRKEQEEKEKKEQEQQESGEEGEGEEGEGEEDEKKPGKGKKSKSEAGEESESEEGEGEPGDDDDDDDGKSSEGEDGDGEDDADEDGEAGDKADDKSDGKDDKADDKADKADDKEAGEGKSGSESDDTDDEDDDGEGSASDEDEDEDGETSGSSDSDGKDGGKSDEKDSPADKSDATADADESDDAGDEEETELTPEEKAEVEKALEGDAEGKDLAERGNDEIEEALKDVAAAGGDIYTSRRDMDEHRTPILNDDNRKEFTEAFNEMATEVAAMAMALEQALRAMTRCRKESFLRSGRLDNDRLVEIAKNLSKNIFFQKRMGKELKTAVVMAIDQSGSMGNILQIRDLVILLSECMYRLGIPFEIIGTTTKFGYGSAPELDGFTRTNPIIYDHYKTFEEQWPVVASRLMQMNSHIHNIDGEVVEFAARRLMNRREDRKIVFSLCDGEPCGGQGNDDKLATNITRVAEVSRLMGVEIFGVGIGTKRPAAYYGKENFIYLENDENKGEKFVRAFAGILTKGEVKL